MRRNLFLLIPLLFFNTLRSQIGIGLNVTTFDDSEVLKIVSANKGILFPNVSIPDLALANPVDNPANSLLVYNTNLATGKGLYYWLNNKWNPMLDTRNVYKYLGIVRTENTTSISGVNDSSPITGVSYNLGESPAVHQFQLIPGLSKTVSLYSGQNNLSITASGIAQVNSTSTADTFMSYSIGLFVDSKLAAVRNFLIYGRDQCLYNDFNVFFNINNLSSGNHLLELRETLRVTEIAGQSITFGSKHSDCNNLSAVMDKSLMNIQISEK